MHELVQCGLSSGAAPTTLGLSKRDAAREGLGLPETMEAHCLIPVGYQMGNFGLVTRLPVEANMRWDRCDKGRVAQRSCEG